MNTFLNDQGKKKKKEKKQHVESIPSPDIAIEQLVKHSNSGHETVINNECNGK